MKKNKKTYLLLIVVFAIWGVLGFKIVNTINPPKDQKAYSPNNVKFTPPAKLIRDTFSILANYRDPFLGSLPVPKVQKTHKIKEIPKEREIEILYTGFIKESSSGAKIFFIDIDREQHMMSINDTFKEVRLLSGNTEKVKVKVRGKIKNITLQK
ncbi:hypothetical protein QSE00_23780 [Arenibacter sp. M-2]|uniref:hypothetical protein n=1 Tax=Arenibacter sp. M-2 TaxID=3053612 RepID=UPI00257123E5|nr:hypothetical protein [Arenibacter sp. M-2]MDL5514851.1 hypothetical protein [Arenibacter sp. M-2]